MGVRSAEAIARRAAKRGRTIEEQATADSEAEVKRAKLEVEKTAPPPPAAIPPPAAAAAADLAVGQPVWKAQKPEGKLKKDEKAGWICMGRAGQQCGFLNFAFRTDCKQCGAVRLVMDGPGKKAKKEAKKKLSPNVKRHAGAAAASPHAKDVGPGSGTAWDGTNKQGSEAANMALRQTFRDDPDSLSEADRTRAEALIARDERKKGKKEARRAAVSHAGLGKRKGPKGPGKLSVVRGPAPGGGGRFGVTQEGHVEVRTGSSRFD